MRNNKLRAICVALGTAGLLTQGVVFAQSAPAVKPEKIEVTGSNIKRVDAESSAPIQVITQEEIRRSGRQTVTELLRELPINATGGLTELSGSGSFSAGAASVSLRGLGSSSTLVLLNGRRIAPYGLADPNFGQASAVNLNAIPVTAIERIEILKDGASAIYGSEAIAGVINIILRKDYRGGEIGGTHAQNKEGLYRNNSASASLGFGDLAKDRYNAFVNFEGYKQQNVLFNDVRDFLLRGEYREIFGTGDVSSSFSPFLTLLSNGTRLANGTLVPVATPGAGCPTPVPLNFNGFSPATWTGTSNSTGNACAYTQQFSRSEIVPKLDRYSVFARGTLDVSATTQLYAELSVVRQNTFFLGIPRAVGQSLGVTQVVGPTVFNSLTGQAVPQPISLVAGHPNNPFPGDTRVRARFDAVGNQDNEVESTTNRGVVGVKSTIGRYDLDAGLLYSSNEVISTNYNELRNDRVAQAFGYRYDAAYRLIPNLAGGTFNFANPSAGQITPDMLRINPRDVAKSSFGILDARMSGELFATPSGAASFAAGLEFRRESRSITPDADKARGNVLGRGLSTADATRNISTLFGELVIPVAKNAEIQVAARYDRYSDYGSSTTPKFAFSWAPLSDVKIRGSFARGFRAPSLTEITRSNAAGFFNGFDDPRRCFVVNGVRGSGCGISVAALIFGNPNVQPEKATTYSGGFVWDVTKETSLTVDYFSIARRNEIGFISLADILNNEGSNNPLFIGTLVRDPGATDPAIPNDPGAITAILPKYTNLGETRVRGFDIDLRSRFSLGAYGRLTLQALLTVYTDLTGSGVAGAPLINFNGFRNAPEERGSVVATWNVGDWTHRGAANYLGSFKTYAAGSALAGTCGNTRFNAVAGLCTVKEYVTLDASTEYRGFKNWRLNFAVRNLANQRPSNDPQGRTFNFAWYQPQGINFVAGARYSWN
jgi:iron complex outermembrane recepter protein